MASNTFGKLFAVTTFGESHGPAIGCVVDGCPPGIALAPEDFVHDLARRATGRTRHTSQRHEADEVEILSGVYEGRTTGAPIALLVRNVDARSRDYAKIADRFRPGHADYTYWHKYGIRDPARRRPQFRARDHDAGGRGGGREEMAGGALRRARARLRGADRRAVPGAHDWAAVEANPFFWPDAAQVGELEAYMDALRKSGDSVGARIDVVADGVPPGWGEPVYGKLDAEIAAAMMSINAVKGVEIGAGFAAVAQKGSAHRDEMTPEGFLSNHAGGVLGGISSGQEVTVSVAFKPTSSLRLPARGLDVDGNPVEVVTTGRHDPCVGLRAVPICEAMLALVLMDQALRHRAQCGDVGPVSPRIP
jgi:chorismate synthase